MSLETTNPPAPSSPSRPLIEAMVEFHRTVGKIGKGGKAQYGNYASLKDILEVITPALTQSGLVLTQNFEPPVEPSLPPVLVTRLIHVSGDFIESKLPMIIPKGRGNAMHDFGGAITYLKRYALLPILGLEADMEEQPERLDDDGDRFSPEPVSKPARSMKKPEKARSMTPEPSPAAPGVKAEDQPIDPQELKALLGTLKEMGESELQPFMKAFTAVFPLPPNGRVSEAITSVKHQTWINDYFKSNA